jgi:hypothetical protein
MKIIINTTILVATLCICCFVLYDTYNEPSDAEKLVQQMEEQNKQFKERAQTIEVDGKLRIATLKLELARAK